MAGHVRAEIHDGVATLLLDHRERRNALTVAMWEDLERVSAELAQDDRVRVVVVRGAGDVAFASGADISEFRTTRADADQNRAYDELVGRATDALAAVPVPVVAAVHGFCMGGGLAVALAADLRIVADDAAFAIPAARLGVGYMAAGVKVLLDLVGPSATKRIIMTGSRFTAAEALTMGLVDEVVPKASLDDHVADLAATMAANAPLTLRAVKATVADLLRPDSEQDRAAVDRLIGECFDSEDFAEGVRAFLEKRPPGFRGR